MSLLGIDVGTSGCKTAAFSEDGVALPAPTANTPSSTQPGWAELDSRRVWDCVRENIAEVAAKVSNDPVRALCVSSMGEAATPVTLDRRVLGPCILSSDTRGSEYIKNLDNRFPRKSSMPRIRMFWACSILSPSFCGAGSISLSFTSKLTSFCCGETLLRSCWAVSPSLIIPSPIAPFFSTFTSRIGRIDCWA